MELNEPRLHPALLSVRTLCTSLSDDSTRLKWKLVKVVVSSMVGPDLLSRGVTTIDPDHVSRRRVYDFRVRLRHWQLLVDC